MLSGGIEVEHWLKMGLSTTFSSLKIWFENEFPLIPVGRLTLNRNPSDYFTEIEQAAFSPAHMIPGVEASPDKMLQGRLFAYGDTHRHRLGANYRQIPVNQPRVNVTNYQRDGPMRIENQAGAPNYFPNSFQGPEEQPEVALFTKQVSAPKFCVLHSSNICRNLSYQYLKCQLILFFAELSKKNDLKYDLKYTSFNERLELQTS